MTLSSHSSHTTTLSKIGKYSMLERVEGHMDLRERVKDENLGRENFGP